MSGVFAGRLVASTNQPDTSSLTSEAELAPVNEELRASTDQQLDGLISQSIDLSENIFFDVLIDSNRGGSHLLTASRLVMSPSNRMQLVTNQIQEAQQNLHIANQLQLTSLMFFLVERLVNASTIELVRYIAEDLTTIIESIGMEVQSLEDKNSEISHALLKT